MSEENNSFPKGTPKPEVEKDSSEPGKSDIDEAVRKAKIQREAANYGSGFGV